MVRSTQTNKDEVQQVLAAEGIVPADEEIEILAAVLLVIKEKMLTISEETMGDPSRREE